MEQAENIRFLRKRGQFTQKDFADLFNVKRAHILDLERGKVKLSQDLALNIAEYFGISLIWLLYGKGSMYDCAAAAEKALESSNVSEPSIPYNIETDDPDIRAVVRLMEGLPEEKKKSILEFCKDKKLLDDLQKERMNKGAG